MKPPETNTNSQTPVTQHPGENHRCLHCNYSLRNLPSFTCPECGHVNDAHEAKFPQQYITKAKKIVAFCIILPLCLLLPLATGLLAKFNLSVPLAALALAVPFSSQIVLSFIAASYLTKIQRINRRFYPEYTIVVLPKIILFSLHLIWLNLIPVVYLYLLFTIFNPS